MLDISDHNLVKIDKETGLLNIAVYLPSPNFDPRPHNIAIDLLVIHNISLPPGEFSGNAIDQFFCNELNFQNHPYYLRLVNVKVSAHLLIRRDGTIMQYVPFHHRAWHAGESCFDGREKCNDFSIGIELEGADDIPYTDEQYQYLSLVTLKLMECYSNITHDRIVGHCDIAPNRKTDPGPAFDWDRFYKLITMEVR